LDTLAQVNVGVIFEIGLVPVLVAEALPAALVTVIVTEIPALMSAVVRR
jgi:hypothetical protein